MKRILSCALAILAAWHASAHRLDECLQGTFILVASNRVSVELDLTPGVAVADGILAMADTDRDGVVGPAESTAFASMVLRSLTLGVDGIPRPLALVGTAFPSAAELKTGNAVIQLEYETAAIDLSVGKHRLEYTNRWEPVRSVYLANALMPTHHSVHVTGQRRSTNQAELTVELEVDAGLRSATTTPHGSVWPKVVVPIAAALAFGAWLRASRRGCGKT